jgi:hypothetical protein
MVLQLIGSPETTDRVSVFRAFLAILFEKCPAAQMYDNLDPRLLRVEAELWAKYRALITWLAAEERALIKVMRQRRFLDRNSLLPDPLFFPFLISSLDLLHSCSLRTRNRCLWASCIA